MDEYKGNPLIEPENYYEGYKKSIEELKNNPKLLEFDKLCYQIFENTDAGKKFIELIKERYLIPAIVGRSQNYQVDVLWQEGFKDFPRMIINCVNSHKQRISA